MDIAYTVCLFFVSITSLVMADLQYECTKGTNGKVIISVDKGLNNLASADMTVPGNKPCTVTNETSEFQLKDCPADTDIKVKVTMEKRTDHVVTDKDIAAYTLRCHYDTKIFYAMVSAANIISVTDATSTPPTVNVHNVKMPSPTPPTFTMTLDQNQVNIGDKVKITISTTGNETFSPEECVAMGKSYNHTLWSSDCNDVDGELFTSKEWTNETSTSITHSFFAFRFTDSSEITLICKLKVCPAGLEDKCSLGCVAGGSNGVTKATGRRRRSITEEDTAVVQTSFTVSDSESAFTESSAGTSLPTSFVFAMLGLYALYSRM